MLEDSTENRRELVCFSLVSPDVFVTFSPDMVVSDENFAFQFREEEIPRDNDTETRLDVDTTFAPVDALRSRPNNVLTSSAR